MVCDAANVSEIPIGGGKICTKDFQLCLLRPDFGRFTGVFTIFASLFKVQLA